MTAHSWALALTKAVARVGLVFVVLIAAVLVWTHFALDWAVTSTSASPNGAVVASVLHSDLNACDRYAPTDSDAHVRSATDPRRP